MAEKQALTALFEKYIRKLRITPAWDVRLEFVEDPAWPKTGDIKNRLRRQKKSFNDLYEGLKSIE